MFTAAQIADLAKLESDHAAARVTLQARHVNEREELLANQGAERKALIVRLGLGELPVVPGSSGPVVPASRRPAARPNGARRGG